MDKEQLKKDDMENQVKREITIMKNLNHPCIVKLYEVIATKEKIYMVMELVPGGELFDKIVAKGPLKVGPTASDFATLQVNSCSLPLRP